MRKITLWSFWAPALLALAAAGPVGAGEPPGLEDAVRAVAGRAVMFDPALRLADTYDALMGYALLRASVALHEQSWRDHVEQYLNYHIRQKGLMVISSNQAAVGLPLVELYTLTGFSHFRIAADRVLNRVQRHMNRLEDGTVSTHIEGRVAVDQAFDLVPFMLGMAALPDSRLDPGEAVAQYLGVRRLTGAPGTAFSRHAFFPGSGLSPEVYAKSNALAAAAAALGLDLLPRGHEQYKRLMLDYKRLMLAAALSLDPESGMWRNIPTRPETPADSGATGLFVFAMLRGLDRGWLPAVPFRDVAAAACGALLSNVTPDGRVGETTGMVEPGPYRNYRLPPIGYFTDGAAAFLLAGVEALETGFPCPPAPAGRDE